MCFSLSCSEAIKGNDSFLKHLGSYEEKKFFKDKLNENYLEVKKDENYGCEY